MWSDYAKVFLVVVLCLMALSVWVSWRAAENKTRRDRIAKAPTFHQLAVESREPSRRSDAVGQSWLDQPATSFTDPPVVLTFDQMRCHVWDHTLKIIIVWWKGREDYPWTIVYSYDTIMQTVLGGSPGVYVKDLSRKEWIDLQEFRVNIEKRLKTRA